MWKLKNVESIKYFMNFEYDEQVSILKVYISNFHKLWSTEQSEKEIIEMFNTLNPLIEASEKTVISEIKKLFDVDRIDVDWCIKIEKENLKLLLKTNFQSISLSTVFLLNLVDTEEYFQIMLKPLLIIIRILHEKNERLIKNLKKKNREIEEYKLEGAVLSRKNVETSKFDDITSGILYEDCLHDSSFNNIENLLDESFIKYFNDIHKFTNEKQNKINISTNNFETNLTSTSNSKTTEKPKPATYTEVKFTDASLLKPVIKKKSNFAKRLKNL